MQVILSPGCMTVPCLQAHEGQPAEGQQGQRSPEVVKALRSSAETQNSYINGLKGICLLQPCVLNQTNMKPNSA